MPGALGAIGGVLGGLGSLFGGGGGGAGGILKGILGALGLGTAGAADVMRAREQQQVINQILDWIKMLEKTSASDITSQAEQAARPLSTGLIENVGNIVQAQLGERGLAGSPGMAAEFMGQALAPYEMQLLRDALQAEFFHLDEPIKALGLASSSLAGGGSDLSPLLAALISGKNVPPFDPNAPVTDPGFPGGTPRGDVWGGPVPGAPDFGSLPISTADLGALGELAGAGG